MKQLSRCHAATLFASAFAVVSLTGCNGAGAQSSAPAVNGQQPLQSDLIGSTGEKKVGQYVWVWRSTRIVASKVAKITVACPQGDVVLSGGYQGLIDTYHGGFSIYGSGPSPSFDAWIVYAVGTGRSGTTKMTVYADCAPAK